MHISLQNGLLNSRMQTSEIYVFKYGITQTNQFKYGPMLTGVSWYAYPLLRIYLVITEGNKNISLFCLVQ